MAKAEAKAIISLRARKFYHTLGNVKKATYQAGKYLAGLGIAGGIFSLKRAAEFSQGLAKINTIARLTQPQLKRFGNEVAALSQKMGKGKAELFDSIYAALSGGVDTGKVLQFTELADKLGKVGQGTSDEAAEALLRLRKAFPDQADADIANTVFSTVEKGIITIADLGGNVGKIAGPAAAAGVGMNELMASIATLSGQMKPEEAITGLRAAIDKLITPGADLAEVFRQMGVKSGEAAIRQFGLLGTLKKIGAIGGTTATQLAKLFPEKRARVGVMGLTGKQGKEAIKTLKAMKAGAGDVETAFSRWTMNNDMHQFEELKQQFDNIAITVGQNLMPTAKDAVAELAKFADSKENIEGLAATMQGLAMATTSAVKAVSALVLWGQDKTNALVNSDAYQKMVKTIAANGGPDPYGYNKEIEREKLEATGDGDEQQLAAQKLRARGLEMSAFDPDFYQHMVLEQMKADRASGEIVNYSIDERKEAVRQIRADGQDWSIAMPEDFDAEVSRKLQEIRASAGHELDNWTPETGGDFIPTKSADPALDNEFAANFGTPANPDLSAAVIPQLTPIASADITTRDAVASETLAEIRRLRMTTEERLPQ